LVNKTWDIEAGLGCLSHKQGDIAFVIETTSDPATLAKPTTTLCDDVLLTRRPEAIQAMFARVACGYDLLNLVLGGGADRWWRHVLVGKVARQKPARVLDLATGSGDVLRALNRSGAYTDRAVGADFCLPMLQVAQGKKLANLVVGDALKLPFANASFDAITISFGFRNLADREAGLQEMRRVLRPGGKAYILEFSHPVWWFAGLYFWYLKNLMPIYASCFSKERGAYAYLGASIRAFPQQQALKEMMERCGFQSVRYTNLTLGIVALHEGESAEKGTGIFY
jgi:demethylmenaquinone methyltransferase/2-methoxy-6-polyprenyl-1,4-benzoquinol methylase